MNTVTRSVEGATVATSAKKRTVTGVWSTDETDRYRTAFVQTGIELDEFMANPLISWEHFRSAVRETLPIGHALEAGVEKYKGKNSLIGVARFGDDEFSEARFKDYESGRLRAWSIQVQCFQEDATPPTPAERRARPDWDKAEIVYRRTKLLEVAATALPGNASCTTISVERSLAGVQPAVTRAESLARDLAPNINRLLKEVSGGAVEGMSVDELQTLIERLQLELKVGTLTSARERQKEWARFRKEYEQLPRTLEAAMARSTQRLCRNCAGPIDNAYSALCRYCR